MSSCGGNHNHQCNHEGYSSVQQTLQEMDFERGIWSAAVDGDLDRVLKYLRDGNQPDEIDSSGYTAMLYAASHGHAQVCKLLLDHGSSVNAQTRSGKATALHRAAYKGHQKVIDLLIQYKADVTMCDADGQNALHKAVESGHVNIVKKIISLDNSLIFTKDNRGRTPAECQRNYDEEMDRILRIDPT